MSSIVAIGIYRGAIGLTGAQGSTGAIGPTGNQGMQGCQGPTGAGWGGYSRQKNLKEYFLKEINSHKIYTPSIEMGLLCLNNIPNEIIYDIVNKVSRYCICSLIKFTKYDNENKK